MADLPRPRRKRYLFLLTILAVTAFALWQRQFIYDQVKLFGYQPSSEISQLATDTAMTDGSRRVFYVNRPELKTKQTFGEFCSTGTEQTVVLGCYKGPQRGIFLLAVDNTELNGIEEVTAAHEMLHAEYDRLSGRERKRVDALLQDYYDTKLDNADIKKTVDGYRKTEPDDLVNEMHSIFGTQVADLPAELEQYYAKFFSDRSKVVKLYMQYEQAFSSRKAQIEQFDAELTSRKQQLDQLETTVDSQAGSLQSQRSALSRSEASGNVAAYNSQVDAYNAAVNVYNANIRRLRDLVNQYNALVEKRNAISFEEQKLVEAISTPAAQQQ